MSKKTEFQRVKLISKKQFKQRGLGNEILEKYTELED